MKHLLPLSLLLLSGLAVGHTGDRERLDQYFTSVCEVERRLVIAEEWERKPKPKVDAPVPKEEEYLPEKLGAMYDLAHLAFDKTNNYPLPNLFVTMLQRLGFEADKFASSTGTMRGLELA